MTAFFLKILKYILFIYINYFSLYELIYGALSMLLLLLELSENAMVVDKHFQKDIEMLQMT
jgi:hypothetical protein